MGYRFSIGDKVRVRDDIVGGGEYPMQSGPNAGEYVYVNENMADCWGKEFTIDRYRAVEGIMCYGLKEVPYGWPDTALEPVMNCLFHPLIV